MIADKRQRDQYTPAEIAVSDWHVLMKSGDVSDTDRSAFQAWLKSDPEHQRLYDLHDAAWGAITEMKHLAYLKEAPPSFTDQISAFAAAGVTSIRPGFAIPIGAAAAMLFIMVGVSLSMNFRNGADVLVPDYETQVAEIRDVTLDDGSIVTLGAASSLDVAFSVEERRVTLSEGEAFFSVEKDATRPFIVVAGDAEVRVVGTKFDVHHGAAAVRVSVLEGVVEVARPEDAVVTSVQTPDKHILTAGQQVVAAKSGEIAAPREIDTADLAPWREGRLVYVDAYLKDIIDDVNRYYSGKIDLADAAAGELQLSLALRTDQIDRMLEVLTTALPVEAETVGGDRVVIRSKPENG